MSNTGHGHVFPREDGVKARCGGPGICSVCSAELARSKMPVPQPDNNAGSYGSMEKQLEALGVKPEKTEKLLAMFDRAGGWRLRSEIYESLDWARTSLSVADAHQEQKHWKMMLAEIADAQHAIEEIKKTIAEAVAKLP